MTYQVSQLLSEGKKRLAKAGKPINDASLLFEFVTGLGLHQVLMEANQPVSLQAEKVFLKCIEKRCQGVPVQEMTQIQNFYGYDFYVNKKVLTPRPETEQLVSLVLDHKKPSMTRVLDLCTGSGCIAISLALEDKALALLASDLSESALQVADYNRQAHQVQDQVTLIQSDLFDQLQGMRFDIIVSNPPYIGEDEYKNLSEEVLKYDPPLALLAGDHGLAFYKRLLAQGKKHLNDQGLIIVEIGYQQGAQVKALFKQHKFENIFIYQDYNGLDRIVGGYYNKEVIEC